MKKKIPDEISEYFAEIGRRGGKIGGKVSRGGGRPPRLQEDLTEAEIDAQKARRARYLNSKIKKRQNDNGE